MRVLGVKTKVDIHVPTWTKGWVWPEYARAVWNTHFGVGKIGGHESKLWPGHRWSQLTNIGPMWLKSKSMRNGLTYVVTCIKGPAVQGQILPTWSQKMVTSCKHSVWIGDVEWIAPPWATKSTIRTMKVIKRTISIWSTLPVPSWTQMRGSQIPPRQSQQEQAILFDFEGPFRLFPERVDWCYKIR